MQRGRGAGDVREGIERADLVKADLRHSDTMDPCLRRGEQLEDLLRQLSDRPWQLRRRQHDQHVRESAVDGAGLRRDLGPPRPQPMPAHIGQLERDRLPRYAADGGERCLDGAAVGTGVEQRRQDHVTSRPAARVDPEASQVAARTGTGAGHGFRAGRRAMRAAQTAAPNPLSMLTTLMPGAQALSIVSSAAIPPRPVP